MISEFLTFILVTKKAFDPSGRNLYHKLCKEEGTRFRFFISVQHIIRCAIDCFKRGR